MKGKAVKLENIEIGETYLDWMGDQVEVQEIVSDKKLKPIVAKNIETGKTCFYHIGQLFEQKKPAEFEFHSKKEAIKKHEYLFLNEPNSIYNIYRSKITGVYILRKESKSNG